MTGQYPGKVAIIVESLYIPEEIRTYRERLEQAGLVVELVATLGEGERITIYSDNVSDIPFRGEKPMESLQITVDTASVLAHLSEYAAVMVAANYTSVRNRYSSTGNARNAPAVRLIAAAMRDGKIVKSALCHGLWLLTPIPEHLAGRRVICHEVVRPDIQNAGGIVVASEGRVVADDDLVTGYSSHEADELVRQVIERIQTVRAGRQLRPEAPHARFTLPPSDKIRNRRILVLLSEWGYWGEELIGPLDVFDAAGYDVDFCTPTGRRPNAIPVSMDPEFIDPPLGRSVTDPDVAARVRLFDSPETAEGRRLEHPLNLSKLIPERPYAAAPAHVRALEAYTRAVERATSELTETHDALVIVGGSGPLVDLANNGRVHELLLGFVRAGRPVAAECYGVSCLAFARQWEDRASILRGKFVTGHCLEYDYHSGTAFVKSRGQFLMDGDEVFNFGPPPYPLEHILRDATAPGGGYVGNFGRETSVVVDYPFITGRSTPDSYLTGQKLVEVLELGLRQWGIPNRPPLSTVP